MSENWFFVPNNHRHRKHDGSPYNEPLDFGVHNCQTHSQDIYIYVRIYIYEPFGSRSFNIAMEAMADRRLEDSGLLIAWDRTRKHMEFIRKYGSLADILGM